VGQARVIDPESGLDAVWDVAIAAGPVARVGRGLPPGRADVPVAGLVVTAGFIDLHSHAQDIASVRLRGMRRRHDSCSSVKPA